MKKDTASIVSKLGGLLDNRKQLARIVVIIIIIISAVGLRIYQSNRDSVSVSTSDNQSEEASTSVIYVDISGAVEKPGIYKLDSKTRLYEVIEKAGGLKDSADIDQINQAEFVEDGQKIVIPTEGDSDSSSSGGTGSTESGDGKININSASKEELETLTGVGEAIAERIIDYRESTRFKSIEDIKNVSGIGDKTFEKMKDYITV